MSQQPTENSTWRDNEHIWARPDDHEDDMYDHDPDDLQQPLPPEMAEWARDNGTIQMSGAPSIEDIIAMDPDGWCFAVEKQIWDTEEGLLDQWSVIKIFKSKEPAMTMFDLLEQQSAIAGKLRQIELVHNHRVQAYKIEESV